MDAQQIGDRRPSLETMKALIFSVAVLTIALEGLMGNTTELKELSSTRYKFSGIFHVFDATFRGPLEAISRDPLDEFPKELEFEYVRKIGSEQLVGAADKILRKNVSPAELAKLESQIEELNAAYRDVGRGDRYTLRYEPGKGTSLLLNGDVIHEVPGDDFHRIYFSIWLGPESPFDLRPQS